MVLYYKNSFLKTCFLFVHVINVFMYTQRNQTKICHKILSLFRNSPKQRTQVSFSNLLFLFFGCLFCLFFSYLNDILFNKLICFVCLLGVFRPTREIFTHIWRRHHYRLQILTYARH